ncbi:MAG: DUF362 domain-containing protein [Treponema sp.]|nr:DUF362 domain-containing protein [Treponema sp.]
MEKSKVYWTDFRTTINENLLQKIVRLAKTAGIEKINFKDKFVAIKIHFGEPGNLAYLRPQYAKSLADFIIAKGGRPFLTDSNTLYVGMRKNALDHLDAAFFNGFSPLSTNCHVIIADGLKGTDEAYIDFPEGEFVKEAKIGRAIADADVFISLNHFKLHEATGFGGAIKNIGMGSASRAGKMEQHAQGKPIVQENKCIGCGSCARECGQDAISFKVRESGVSSASGASNTSGEKGGSKRVAFINQDLCVGCGRCIGACPTDATEPQWDSTNEILCQKMAEYACATVKGKEQFHITLICNVSPCCDCHAENDAPLIQDIGMFASFDAVALDKACADAVNKMKPLTGTVLDKIKTRSDDLFSTVHPTTKWIYQLTQGEKCGLGKMDYELVKI